VASAGPIRIAILANASQAVQEVTGFRKTTEDNVQRVVTTMADPKLEGAFGRAQEGFDLLDTRAMGFRDTITGVQDSVAGFNALMGKGEHANDSFGDKLLLLGMGVGDLASGFANFIVPLLLVITNLNRMALASARSTVSLVAQRVAMVAAGTAARVFAAAQWLVNAAMAANPVGLIILAIVALVAIIVIAYKKSDTFRRIVGNAFEWVQKAAAATWNWIKGNWPLLLAIITGPIGLAVLWVVRNFDRISAAVKAIPGIVKSAFVNANVWLINAGRAVVEGMWNGIVGAGSWIWGKIQSFVSTYITGPIRSALGIASPSRVGKELGRWFSLGVGEGVDDSSAVNRVRSAAGRLAAATIPNAPAGTASTDAGFVISFDGAGDPLLQAILNELRKYIRVNGGSAQKVLGT
jgi:hypothetical protein